MRKIWNCCIGGQTSNNPTLEGISNDQDIFYFVKPQQENSIGSENEKLETEVANAIGDKLNTNVSSSR
jgi:hypothetical protein